PSGSSPRSGSTSPAPPRAVGRRSSSSTTRENSINYRSTSEQSFKRSWTASGAGGSRSRSGIRANTPRRQRPNLLRVPSTGDGRLGVLGLAGLVVRRGAIAGEGGVGPGGEVAESAAEEQVVPELGRDDRGQAEVEDDPAGRDSRPADLRG